MHSDPQNYASALYASSFASLGQVLKMPFMAQPPWPLMSSWTKQAMEEMHCTVRPAVAKQY